MHIFFPLQKVMYFRYILGEASSYILITAVKCDCCIAEMLSNSMTFFLKKTNTDRRTRLQKKFSKPKVMQWISRENKFQNFDSWRGIEAPTN